MKKALVIGSLNMDMTVKVEELPKLGETIFGNDFYGGAVQGTRRRRGGAGLR